MNRKWSLAALFGVVAVSIVFGMIVGGRLNAPAVLHAAPAAASAAAVFPAAASTPTRTIELPDFSEIAAETLPAVVGVQNTTVDKTTDSEGEGDDDEDGDDDRLFRFFSGPRTGAISSSSTRGRRGRSVTSPPGPDS